MLQVFSSLRSLLKIDAVCIDNTVFKLHYKATVIILVTFSLIVTSRQYIGDPIDCIVDEIPLNVMDTYCWIYSTYTVPNKLTGRIGKDVIQPGVGSHVDGDELKYHKYYQWVCFALFFQAMLFYIPRYLWKIWEAGKIRMLVQELNTPIIIGNNNSQKGIDDKRKVIVEYFYNNLQMQDFYVYRFIVCEVLNLFNVIAQLYFMDYFLEGEFSKYGLEVWNFSEENPDTRVDPMARVFPKLTKCTFHKYGPSGSVQKFDGLCVLPLNIVNEKIYIVLWFWFWFLVLITICQLIYRMATIMIPKVRVKVLRARCRFTSSTDIEGVARSFSIGDWFVYNQVCKNVDPITFRDFTRELFKRIEGKEPV